MGFERGTREPNNELVRDVGLFKLCAIAMFCGALAGVVGAAFRLCLTLLDAFRIASVEWLHQWPLIGWTVPVLAAAAAVALARLLVIKVPTAAGSGIQHVEACVRGQVEAETAQVIPVKFVGGLLAIGSGLALGREGPTVQMSAAIGSKVSRGMAMNRDDQNTVQASLAGAGLAVAFNAPLGGAIFVVEELTKSTRPRLITTALLATATAVVVMRLLLGDLADFKVPALSTPSIASVVPFIVFGAALGLLGAAYNRLVLLMMNGFESLARIPLLVRAACVGAAVGLLGWFAPGLVGGGDILTADLLVGSLPLLTVAGILLVRWFLGPLSYSVGTPGGLFSPLLLLGAACGILFGSAVHAIAPALASEPAAYALVGMSVFFTAVVRTPITGIALVAEMTATTSQLIPMMLACGAAVVVTTVIGSEPIYDTLRHRMLAKTPPSAGPVPD